MKALRKILPLFVILTLIFSVTASATVLDFTVGSLETNRYDGEALTTDTLDAAPFVNESYRTMVPVRAISEGLGAKVEWDDPTQTVTITDGETVLKLVIGSVIANLNGADVELDSAPVLVNARTFVPLRFIGEALGYNINYCNTTQQIIIDDTPVVIVCGNESITLAEFEVMYNIAINSTLQELGPEGYTEEDIAVAVINACLDELKDIPYALNTFPNMPLSDEYKAMIMNSAATGCETYNVPMTSLYTLLEEKFVFGQLYPAVTYYSNQPEILELAKFYVNVEHILVDDEATANLVYEKAISGEDFSQLISDYNTDPGAEEGGYVFTYGEMDEAFEKASFALSNGEISKPVKTAYGYHIIKRAENNDYTNAYLAALYVINILTSSPEPTVVLSPEEILEAL